MFRSHLAQGLAWRHVTSKDEPIEARDNRFPTWCWASNGPIKFIPIARSYILDVHAQKFPLYPGGTDSFDDRESRLHIKAPVVHVKLIHFSVTKIHNRGAGLTHISCNDEGQLQQHSYQYWLDNQLGPDHPTETNVLLRISTDELFKGVTVQVLLLGQGQDCCHLPKIWAYTNVVPEFIWP